MPLSCTEPSTKHRKEIRAFVPTRNREEDEKQVLCCVHARLFIMPVTIFKPEKWRAASCSQLFEGRCILFWSTVRWTREDTYYPQASTGTLGTHPPHPCPWQEPGCRHCPGDTNIHGDNVTAKNLPKDIAGGKRQSLGLEEEQGLPLLLPVL